MGHEPGDTATTRSIVINNKPESEPAIEPLWNAHDNVLQLCGRMDGRTMKTLLPMQIMP